MGADAVRSDSRLLEREAELELFGALVAGARTGEGALVVVEGQAGVGKTSLLRAAARLGESEGLRVVRGRGSELDRPFAFGLVRQLFEREVSSEPELLTGGAEAAAGVFGPAVGDGRGEEGLFGSLRGLYWLVSNLAARRPLVLLADDLQVFATPLEAAHPTGAYRAPKARRCACASTRAASRRPFGPSSPASISH